MDHPVGPVSPRTRILSWRVVATLLLVVSLSPMLIPGPVSAHQAGGAGVKYELFIDCPTTQGVRIDTTATVPGCPVRAVDGQDQMGDPSIAVDPMDPNNLIIASLHGRTWNGGPEGEGQPFISTGAASCGEKGPTPKSRCGQVFTTFTSTDAGGFWSDNPFFPPERIGFEAFGETTAITIDPYGHVFVGSLYATPAGAGGEGFQYQVVAQKFSDLGSINSDQDGEFNAEYLDPIYPTNRIEDLWFVFDPRQDNMTMVWTERLATLKLPPPCDIEGNATRVGDSYVMPDASVWMESNGKTGLQTDRTCPSDPDSRFAVTPMASPTVPTVAASAPVAPRHAHTHSGRAVPVRSVMAANETGNRTTPVPDGTPMSVIAVLWTGIESNDTYHYQRHEDVIGPCIGSTNPVLSDGYLYVGCVAAPEEGLFRWNPDTIPHTVELFRMDPSGGTPTYLGASPVIGGNPRLGVRSDGRLAVLSAQAKDGQLQVQAAFGQYRESFGGIEWSALTAYGDQLQGKDPAIRYTDANVQDLIYREYSGVVHLILKTRQERTTVSASAPEPPLKARIHKAIVAIDETHRVVYHHDLDIGNLVNRTSDPDLMQAREAAYDDIKDDFLQLPPGNWSWTNPKTGDVHEFNEHYQREFFAIADYGQVIFAELIEVTELRGPGYGTTPPDPLGIPAAAQSSSLTTAVVGSTAGVGALAIAATLLSNRRKNPIAAIARRK